MEKLGGKYNYPSCFDQPLTNKKLKGVPAVLSLLFKYVGSGVLNN